MKRAFGLGLGVAMAATSTAAGPKRVSVHPAVPPPAATATPAAALPPGLKYADQWGGSPALAAPAVIEVGTAAAADAKLPPGLKYADPCDDSPTPAAPLVRAAARVIKPVAETITPVAATAPDVAVAPVASTGITAAAADFPVTPTVPAPGQTGAGQTVAFAEAAPVPATAVEVVGPADAGPGCATCAPAVAGTGRHRGGFGSRVVGWFAFRPGPAVLPRFVPTPYQVPLLSYFPSGPVPLPPAPVPGPVVIVGNPAAVAPPAPPVATPTPKDAAPVPAPRDTVPPPAPVPNRLLKAEPATPAASAEARFVPRAAAPTVEIPASAVRTVEARGPSTPETEGPAIFPAGGPGPADPAVPSATPAPTAVQPASPKAVEGAKAVEGPKATEGPKAGFTLPPVAEPPAPRPPVPEPVLTVPAPCSVRTPFDSSLLVSQASVFHKCEQYTLHTPCTGHGDLTGYRFAMPVVSPCRPLGPLMVKNCFGGAEGTGACGAAVPVDATPVVPALETPTPALPAKAGEAVAAVTRPFTRP